MINSFLDNATRWFRERPSPRREFLLTVDVEALPSRTRDEHVDRLIWGRFPETQSQSTGLAEMLAVGDQYGIPVTCFLDMAEVYLYGDSIRDVGRYVHDSGHDLQLHLHPELLPATYWHDAGFKPPGCTQEFYDLNRCRYVMNEFSDELQKVNAGQKSSAYRAGAFRIGRNMLLAQKEAGIPISSNLSYETFVNQQRAPLSSPDSGPFLWDLGLWELPVTQVWQGDKWKVLAMPMQLDPRMNYRRLFRLIDETAPPGPIVMILHSWSMLTREKGKRRFIAPSMARLRKFNRLAEEAARIFEPISMTEMAQRLNSRNRAQPDVRAFPEIETDT